MNYEDESTEEIETTWWVEYEYDEDGYYGVVAVYDESGQKINPESFDRTLEMIKEHLIEEIKKEGPPMDDPDAYKREKERYLEEEYERGK